VRQLRKTGGNTDILLAASLWGTTGTARSFASVQASSIAVGAARIVIGGAVLLLLALRNGRLGALLRRGKGTCALLAIGAACVAIYQLAFFGALARTGVAVGTVVTIGTAPAFTGVLTYATTRTNPGLRWAASTVAAVIGCVLLLTAGATTGADPIGIELALVAGLGYASYAVGASHLIKSGATDQAVVGALFGGAAILLVPVLLTQPIRWLATGSGLLVALYLGVATTGLGYVLYGRGLRTTPVTTATTLGLAEPAVAALLGVVLLHEHLTGLAIAGLALIGLGLVATALTPRGGPRPAATEERQAQLAAQEPSGH
jgi:DME family drug/metabolite transporter